MNQWFKQFTRGLTVGHVLFFGIIATGVFYTGYGMGVAAEGDLRGQRISGQNAEWQEAELAKNDIDFMQFWEVWQSVKDRYVQESIADRDLFYGAIAGIVEGLNDPYSIYFNPQEASDFAQSLEGSFYGIGAELGEDEGGVKVVAPLRGTPAEAAGLQSGDYIIAVDGESADDWSVYDAVDRIRGPEGTKVTLSVLTPGTGMRDISIVRQKIIVDSVTWEEKEGVAVISISQFNQDTLRLFNQAVQELPVDELDGIVLDLRGNPGGMLDQAIAIADFWIDDKIVVVEKTRNDEINIRAGKGAILGDIPTVVLVNAGSASASEIVAGALQDHGMAFIIGDQTFGKGSVQDYEELRDGSALKITVAKWLTPNGNSIDEVGITPDQVITLTQEDYDAEKDTQFEAARIYLENAR